MGYDLPGRADDLGSEFVERWNNEISHAYEALRSEFGSRLFSLDPEEVSSPVRAPIKWFGDPAEPAFCLGAAAAAPLSDWGVRGRHVLHNEYCEYRTIERPDGGGRMRPKRIEVTTELREYWVTVATHDPEALRKMANNVLGFEPTWEDLYGVDDPSRLDERSRERTFSALVAGHGNDRELAEAGVPAQPTGRLNTDNALFMTHPINGLDDLLYIVLFGARPYASEVSGERKPATREQIFRSFGVEHLACRHADPAAAMGAAGAAFEGRTVAFDNPLGMYILSFAQDLFRLHDEPVPDSWVRFSRGQEGMFQRLEFGPSDEEDAFLDDIKVAVGATEEPLTGGFQVVQQIEVGPLVLVGEVTQVAEDEYVVLDADTEQIRCHEADICERIKALQREHEASGQTIRMAPRVMGTRGSET